jgi:hypothetical protein
MKPEILVLVPIYAPTLATLEREARGAKLLANLRAHFAGRPVPTPLT